MVYICLKFCQSISKDFRVIDPDIRVDARLASTVDVRTDRRMNRRKSGYLYLEAGTTKIISRQT